MVDIRKAKEWVMAIILLVIFAAVGVLVVSELYGSIKSGSTTVNNYTLTSSLGTPQALVSGGGPDWPAELSVTYVSNESNGVFYPNNASNWHYNSTYGSVTLLATICSDEASGGECVEADGTNFNITYSYQAGDTKTDTLKNGTLAISNVTKQLPTLGIIMGVLLVIGAVVMMSVYFGKQGGYM